MKTQELKSFLDEKVELYNKPDFIKDDPISIPHSFSAKEDIEISGFLAATISFGNRKAILKSANKMMNLLDNSPYDFIMNHTEKDLETFDGFVHRFFNAEHFKYFVKALKNVYENHGGLEEFFNKYSDDSPQKSIHELRNIFLSIPNHPDRIQSHVSDPLKGSAAKRINMYLRWMVRKDNCGVDLGIWDKISPSILSCPLDVHSGNVARKLGILNRKQDNAKAVKELDDSLRKLDPNDPVKYDFALFGLGIFEGF